MNAPVPAQRGRSARNNRSAYSSMRFSSNSNPLDVLLPWLIIPRKVPNFSFRMLPYDPRQLGSFAEHTINYVKQEDGKAKVGFRSFPCPNYDRHRHQVDPLKDDCPRISAQIKIDYRAGTESRMKSKIASVENQLGRKLST